MKVPYLKTIVPVAIVLFFTLQRGNGPLVVILLLFFLAYLVYSAARMVVRPIERRSRSVRLAIWTATFVLAAGVQGYFGVATRNEAERAVGKVVAFKQGKGAYPATLGDAGVDEKRLKDRWKIRYFLEDGKASLTYPAAFMPLTLCEYDFEGARWRENAY